MMVPVAHGLSNVMVPVPDATRLPHDPCRCQRLPGHLTFFVKILTMCWVALRFRMVDHAKPHVAIRRSKQPHQLNFIQFSQYVAGPQTLFSEFLAPGLSNVMVPVPDATQPPRVIALQAPATTIPSHILHQNLGRASGGPVVPRDLAPGPVAVPVGWIVLDPMQPPRSYRDIIVGSPASIAFSAPEAMQPSTLFLGVLDRAVLVDMVIPIGSYHIRPCPYPAYASLMPPMMALGTDIFHVVQQAPVTPPPAPDAIQRPNLFHGVLDRAAPVDMVVPLGYIASAPAPPCLCPCDTSYNDTWQ
ncbi:hypothetical protein TorRG33x02_315210 [Trema orientale]|uniref:Uncharacterized protein n=1 Tax=Trema orientale TaxID=63057 RepID=A0A2P5BN23_TREOI|nr:hypothetical protein TorRG33x02_315210 [Trema orientale]